MLTATTPRSAATLDFRLMNVDLRTRGRRSNGATGDASSVGRQQVGEHAPERADVNRFFEDMVDAQVSCLLPHAIVEEGRDENAASPELPSGAARQAE
jgi:hypothetical protein